MKQILLTQGKFALVDDEDYEYLNQWKWHLQHKYAARAVKSKTILMHRIINKTPAGHDTDHINGDKLDNRRKNLRNASRAQNTRNRIKRLGVSSKFKGVSATKYGTFKVACGMNGKNVYLGCFSSEIEAAAVYNRFAKKSFGEFARLNQI